MASSGPFYRPRSLQGPPGDKPARKGPNAGPDYLVLEYVEGEPLQGPVPVLEKWLARHRRFHVYFTPTSSSWLNMVERFFRDLTQNRLRRGIFRDVEELIMAIGDYIDQHNDHPKPFVWTAKASDILEKVKRARHALDNR